MATRPLSPEPAPPRGPVDRRELAVLARLSERVAGEVRALAERASEVGSPPPGYDWEEVRRLADGLHTLALRYAVDADDADVFFDLFFDLVDRRGRGRGPEPSQ
jgi:hypothetical protein